MKTFINSIILLAILALYGCNSQTKTVTINSTNNNEMNKEIDTLFSSLFRGNEPGAYVLIAKGDSIVYSQGFGLACLDTNTPLTDSTMMNICSVSKQFSAVALCMLAEQGKLSLDDSVKKFFPNFKADFFNHITLRHLMSHTSGLPDARPRTQEQWNKYIATNKTKYKSVEEFKLYCEEEESCRYMEKLDSLAFEPGTLYEYQNPTFQLMLMIIEQTTGEKFDTWMHNNIFLPAGMTNTTYFEPNKYIPSAATAYDLSVFDDEEDNINRKERLWKECEYGSANFFGTKADGGLYTTPLEFLKWDKAIYSNSFISQSLRNEFHKGRIDTDIPYTQYGYGWFIEQRPDRPKKIYHTGDNGGFLIFEGRYPEQNLFYLIFANRPDWNREEVVEQMDSIFERANWLDNIVLPHTYS